MIAVVEIDLGAPGVNFPRGEVAMVVAQPFVGIDATLAVSLKAPQNAGKTD